MKVRAQMLAPLYNKLHLLYTLETPALQECRDWRISEVLLPFGLTESVSFWFQGATLP